jgi:hypothetical protein
MRLDPLHRIPNRLPVYFPQNFKANKELEAIAARGGAVFVSAHGILCDEQGCLVRSGDTAKDILQVDLTHYSAAGSWYLIRHAADKIFDGIVTSRTPPQRE